MVWTWTLAPRSDKLLAQAMDIDLDRVRGDLAGMSEDVVLDLLLGDHASLAAHQELEHRGLAGREHLRLIVDRGLPVLRVEREIGDPQANCRATGRAGATALPAARSIPPARTASPDSRRRRCAGHARDHAGRRARSAPAPESDCRAAGARAAARARRRRAVRGRGSGRHRTSSRAPRALLDGRQHVGLVARRFQALRQQLGELLIVFDDQQSHSGSPDRHDNSARLGS